MCSIYRATAPRMTVNTIHALSIRSNAKLPLDSSMDLRNAKVVLGFFWGPALNKG